MRFGHRKQPIGTVSVRAIVELIGDFDLGFKESLWVRNRVFARGLLNLAADRVSLNLPFNYDVKRRQSDTPIWESSDQ